MTADRKMNLGVFVMTAGHHVAAWRRPEAHRGDLFAEFREIAEIAEAAKFDLLFIADSLSTRIANRDAAERSAQELLADDARAADPDLGPVRRDDEARLCRHRVDHLH